MIVQHGLTDDRRSTITVLAEGRRRQAEPQRRSVRPSTCARASSRCSATRRSWSRAGSACWSNRSHGTRSSPARVGADIGIAGSRIGNV